MNLVKEYIQKTPQIHYAIYGRIPLYFRDELKNKININNVIKRVENILPSFLMRNVSGIAIGDYDTLDDREVDSVYDSKIIYLTNVQEDEEDIIENIVHETAHSLEEKYSKFLYDDGLLKKEFLKKRKLLYNELSSKYKIEEKYFRKTGFSKTLDLIFYKKIGYDTLSYFTEQFFVSPYSATSLSEYFSEAFEQYFLGNRVFLEEECPELYKKIVQIEELSNK